MIDSPAEIQARWDNADPRASEERFARLLEGDLSPALRIEVLTHMARAQGLDGRFAEVRSTIDEALALGHAELARDAALVANDPDRLTRLRALADDGAPPA